MNINEISGALARGYCEDENSHKTMDADLCTAQAAEVMKLMTPVAMAMSTLGEAMRTDDDYRNGWHANLSMMMQDSGVARDDANYRAGGFIRMVFDA